MKTNRYRLNWNPQKKSTNIYQVYGDEQKLVCNVLNVQINCPSELVIIKEGAKTRMYLAVEGHLRFTADEAVLEKPIHIS